MIKPTVDHDAQASTMKRGVVALLLASCMAVVQAAPFEDSISQRTLACTGCHGASGRAAGDAFFPRIAGKPAGYLFNQLRNFRDGRRHYGLMSGMVALLSDAYLREIAAHFSALDLPYPAPIGAPMAADAQQRAQELVQHGDPARQIAACTACHGRELTGVAPNVPGLLGLPRDYVNAQLGAWKSGQRSAQAPDCMAALARELSPQEVSDISAWLALQPLPANTRAAAAAPRAEGVAARPVCGSAPELAGRKP